MRRPGDFSKDTLITISRRAALLCSNPDCGVLTSGPDSQLDGITNIGEAAHIYGCGNPSARRKESLQPSELSDITNAIWLCCNCHKQIDDDERRFPAELLFTWKRDHEDAIRRKNGSKSDVILRELQKSQLKDFETCSYLAQQIVLDKPQFWEYRLTLELLRTGLGGINSRWLALKRGLYTKKLTPIDLPELGEWWRVRFEEASRTARALNILVTEEIPKSWGPDGLPGNELEILETSRLIVAACQRLLEWEEDFQFTSAPTEFAEAMALAHGIAGAQIEEVMRIPVELAKIFETENPSGTHKISLVFRLPKSFATLEEVIERCGQAYIANRRG
jgi:hypothetical protein